MTENAENFDVIIIGGGAAGMSAAMWCDELGLATLLLEQKSELGGQLLRIYNAIENHLGISAADGRELRDIFVRQIANRGFAERLETKVFNIDFQGKTVFLNNGKKITARAIIIATGVRRRRLNIEGEEFYADKGILESGKKEQPIVKDKKVLIVGGGDAALENSLILAETAREITLVHRRSEFRGRTEFIEQARQNPKIKLLTETALTKINGDENIEAVELENLQTGQRQTLAVEHILIRIGVEPNTKFIGAEINLDEHGYIKVNQFCETNIENIFAVGDVANHASPTVSTAVGTGATAAKVILNKLLN